VLKGGVDDGTGKRTLIETIKKGPKQREDGRKGGGGNGGKRCGRKKEVGQ